MGTGATPAVSGYLKSLINVGHFTLTNELATNTDVGNAFSDGVFVVPAEWGGVYRVRTSFDIQHKHATDKGSVAYHHAVNGIELEEGLSIGSNSTATIITNGKYTLVAGNTIQIHIEDADLDNVILSGVFTIEYEGQPA